MKVKGVQGVHSTGEILGCLAVFFWVENTASAVSKCEYRQARIKGAEKNIADIQ